MSLVDEPDLAARRVVVSGRVQGVGYRAWVQSLARREGVAGSAENAGDGTVVVVLEGEVGAVAAVEGELRTGPAGAEVEDVEGHDVAPADREDFETA